VPTAYGVESIAGVGDGDRAAQCVRRTEVGDRHKIIPLSEQFRLRGMQINRFAHPYSANRK